MSGKADNYEIEIHPFETFVKSDTKFLVVGTFPTYKENYRDTFDFFYGGKGNFFWNIIERVFDYTFQHSQGKKAVEERQELLRKMKIGITDMHQQCYRKNKKSGDEYLFPIFMQDIFSLLDKHKLIERLVLTSRTEAIGALGLLKTYFLQNNLELRQPARRNDKILQGSFKFDKREIKIMVPYSPSPRVIGNKTTIDELVQMYSRCLTQ